MNGYRLIGTIFQTFNYVLPNHFGILIAKWRWLGGLFTLGQIFCSRGRPLENSRGRPVDFTGRPVNSTGRPLEFSRGRPVNFFIAFLDEIGNSMSFEANLQNSSGRPVGFLEDVQ